MKRMLLSLLFCLVLILALLSSTRAGNVAIPKQGSSYGVIKTDSRADRKVTIISLKDQEDEEGDDEDDDNDDEEEE